VSAEPAARIHELARIAAGHPTLVRALTSVRPGEIQAAVRDVPAFKASLDAYLDKFGDRMVNELKLESLTLHDDPLPLLRSVGAAAQLIIDGAGGDRSAAPGERLRQAARARVDAALARRPMRRLLFRWVLRHARATVRERENLRLERTRLFARVRRIFIEIGRRFHAEGLLAQPRDVFYLEVDEILGAIDGRATSRDLRALVALRRREFDGYAAEPAPPSRFETRGLDQRVTAVEEIRAPEVAADGARRGLGCSPGRVRGPVRVVTDPYALNLEARAILVAEHTDPGWITVFPSARALLVERGSLLSHAAIVARELGIPAVVSVPGLTRWLRDGDVVEVDGAAGTIQRIEAQEAGRAQRSR
jgi:pyruvate,water dikinase